MLGTLLAYTQEYDKNSRQGMFGQSQHPSNNKNSGAKTTTLEDALGLLGQGFLKGGVGSFLKGTGDLMKSSVVSPELRVGVSHAYVVMIKTLGPVYLERQLVTIVCHILELASNPRAGSSHTETVCARNCVTYILSR